MDQLTIWALPAHQTRSTALTTGLSIVTAPWQFGGQQDQIAGYLPAFQEFIGRDRLQQWILASNDRPDYALFQQLEKYIPVLFEQVNT